MKFLTPAGLEKVKAELHQLKTTKRQEIAQRLEEAKALGDLAENAEYTSAKEAQAFNEGKILELGALINEAEIIDPSKHRSGQDPNEVHIGSTVEVQSLSKDQESKQSFTIISSQESDPKNGKISNESPLGKAFLGARKGDTIEVVTPGGKLKYKIKHLH